MTRNEKMLAGVLGAALVFAGGYQVIKAYVIAPRAALSQSIARELERRQTLENNLAPSARAPRAWSERTQLTLGPTLEQARLNFRNDVAELLKRNNLSKDLRIADKTATPFKKGPRSGFLELPVTVNVRGELQDLVNFMKDFYQRPYVKRIDALNVNASSAQSQHASEKRKQDKSAKDPKDKGAAAARPERGNGDYELNVTMTLTTLVLPDVPKLPAERLTAEQLANPELAPPIREPWLAAEDPVTYNRIANVNVFKIFEPPPPPPRPEPTPRPPPVARGEDPPPPPPVDPRKDADQFTLVGVTALHGDLIVYVQDARERTEPATEYRINDKVDDGRLVLVHREGIVVRTRRPDGGTTDWFYPLGTTFANRVELDRVAHADVWQVLQQVTQAPGRT